MISQILICLLYLSPAFLAQYIPTSRWAQAVALLENKLYVHGGLSDPFNSYSYTSAPEISDLLVLDLSTSFDVSSPPWELFSNNSFPALAWHTLSAFNVTEILLFGGQPDPNSLTVLTGFNDSSGLLLTSSPSGPYFLMEPQDWANEPMRRVRHSSSYTSGKVWIIGGEKADGSGNAFSDHYSFSPSGPEFAQLPFSSNAPPDIYGHASLVLPDGRLLVFGGYCASCSGLVPMSTVWCLDTTRNQAVWEELFVSNESLPSPRRNFAAVVLSNGQVLIHGGGDSQLQVTYSDGWILDTDQNPMVWNAVAALEQLGPRKDHFAAQTGDYVLFCFGYGSSSPAPASLFVYDPTASLMVPSYVAPSPEPGLASPVDSLPVPTRTGLGPGSNQATGAVFGGTSSTPSHPSDSLGSSDPSDSVVATALGITFGTLGLVAVSFIAVFCVKRMRTPDRTTAGRFFPLSDDPEFPSSEELVGGAAQEAAHLELRTNDRVAITGILAHLGISKFRSGHRQPRKDMFADEDTRSFGRSSTVQRQDSERASVWSLRSVGALVRGVIGRDPSDSGVNQGDREWKKIDHLREGHQEGLIRQGSLRSDYSSHPTYRRDRSFWSYTDPFDDSIRDNEYDDLHLCPGIPEKDADYDLPVLRSDETNDFGWTALGTRDSVWPFSVRSRMLTPLRESSQTSLSDLCDSHPSLQEPSHERITRGDCPALSPPASISLTSSSFPTSCTSEVHPITPVPQHSTITGSTLSYSPSIFRRDSWWSRLTKQPLLDRRTSITSPKLLDFRDPTPAPPIVVTLEETSGSSSTPTSSNDTLLVEHRRSLSSAYSARTANTDSAELLGGNYDVVQRLASGGSSFRRAPSLGSAEITEKEMLAVDNPEISLSSAPNHVNPPRSTSSNPVVHMDVDVPSEPPTSPKTNPASPRLGAMVTSRVKAYELSQKADTQIPAPRNTRSREEVPSKTRPTIHYGVVPRASLFIANPDVGHVP